MPTDLHDVEQRLAAALHQGLDGAGVDPARLVHMARVRSRRLRRRRSAGMAACVALALVLPLGAALLQDPTSAPAAPAALASTAKLPQPLLSRAETPTTAAPPPATAPVVDPEGLEPNRSSWDIPLAALTRQEDLPVPLVADDMFEPTYRDVPVVMGQECSGELPGLEPAAAAASTWLENPSGPRAQLTVSTQVTGFSRGDGPQAFTEALQDLGRCRWSGNGTISTFSPGVGQQGLSRTRDDGADRESAALLLVGDLLVGVQVYGTSADVDNAALSRSAAEKVAQRLLDLRVPGSQG